MEMKMISFRKLFYNDYVMALFTKFIIIITGIINTALINRYLGPALKGEYAYIINIINLIVIIGNLGLYQSYGYSKRYKTGNILEQYINIFMLQFWLYLILSAVIYYIYRFVDTSANFLLFLLVPIQILVQQLLMITLIEFIRYRQIINIIISIFNLLMTLIIFIVCESNIQYIIGSLLLKDIVCVLLIFRKLKIVPNPFRVSVTLLKSLLKFGLFAMLSALLINLNYKVDILILKKYVNSSEVGLYSVGVALAEYAWIIPDAFKDVLFSKTAKSDAIQSIVTTVKVSIAITISILILVILCGKFFINFLYGYDFLDAYNVTCIIFFGVPSMVLFKLTGPLYMANGKQKFYFITLLVSVLCNVIGNYIIIPMYGKEGSAFVSIISYSICGLVFYIRFIRDYHLSWYDPLIIGKEDLLRIKKVIKNEHRSKKTSSN